MFNLDNRLREMRESRHLTLDQLVELSGVSKSTIVRYEAGGNFRMDNVVKLADAFSVTVEDLIGTAEFIDPTEYGITEEEAAGLDDLQKWGHHVHNELAYSLNCLTTLFTLYRQFKGKHALGEMTSDARSFLSFFDHTIEQVVDCLLELDNDVAGKLALPDVVRDAIAVWAETMQSAREIPPAKVFQRQQQTAYQAARKAPKRPPAPRKKGEE